VAEAVTSLPGEFLAAMDNITVSVSDLPTPHQLRKAKAGRGNSLLGLYECVPLTRRGANYQLVLPDKITLFRLSIEGNCPDESNLPEVIARVLRHEIAHYFGISDARLQEMGRY
jgi:predicted Zn-dependent protease with MMP-like domain